MVFATEFDSLYQSGHRRNPRPHSSPLSEGSARPLARPFSGQGGAYSAGTSALPAAGRALVGASGSANSRSAVPHSHRPSRTARVASDLLGESLPDDKVVPLALAPSAPMSAGMLTFGAAAVRVSSKAHGTHKTDEGAALTFRQPNLSWGLKLLNRIQQGSTLVTTLLVTGALAVYGSTVYVDRTTNRALTRLDSLQGESQELTSANEAIKQSLAEQALREDSGLEPYEAGDLIFVAPEPLRAPVEMESANIDMPRPLGY